MYRIFRTSLAAFIITALLISAVNAEPFYKSRQDYLNKTGGPVQLDRPMQSKSPVSMAASSAAGDPDVEAFWGGATEWMSGINWAGGEAFGGSIGKGINFFGSNLSTGDYVSVQIIFETGAPNQTLCGTFRRDLSYAWGGVGTFPGQAWDISDPDNPRRLNMCFVEDNNIVTANQTWDPNDLGAPTYGKREYVYVMLSDYDGDGLTYNGQNGASGASSLDILFNWWPLVAGGHTFFENEPCTLSVGAYYVNGFDLIMAETGSGRKASMSWGYVGDDVLDHFNIYRSTSPSMNTLFDQVTSGTFEYIDSTLVMDQEYYYRIEGRDGSDSAVASSKTIAVPDRISEGLDFLGNWNGRSLYGDCWGYVDTATDKEYALLCARNEGVSIIDIDVSPPVEVGFMPVMTFGNDSKDVKIYKNYAIVISEYENAQIFDITDVTSPVQVSQIVSEGGSGAHNCMVDGDYLYIVGNHDIGGVEIFDISNPAAPVNVGDFEPFYYHDLDIYNDTLVCAGIYGDGIDLLDVSNKAAPSFVKRFNYTFSGAHNCEFIHGMDYVAIGDEIGGEPHTRIFDLQDLDAINKVADIVIISTQPTHNCYLRNDTLFIAHYALGLRMYDVSDPTNPVSVGYYDTYTGSSSGYVGAWNVYPFFPSGKIIVSDMQTGLYVMEITGTPHGCCVGMRGDVNNDGMDANILDLNFLVNRIFRLGPAPVCDEESDVNSDGSSANILDLNYLINRIFRLGPAPGDC